MLLMNTGILNFSFSYFRFFFSPRTKAQPKLATETRDSEALWKERWKA